MLGRGYDLDTIGAAVIGGTALFGGKGNVIASVWGVLVLAVLNTGLQTFMWSLPSNWRRKGRWW
jgi:ribose/xylose/arabinose/galactoside ABC-type transport system permease subunit